MTKEGAVALVLLRMRALSPMPVCRPGVRSSTISPMCRGTLERDSASFGGAGAGGDDGDGSERCAAIRAERREEVSSWAASLACRERRFFNSAFCRIRRAWKAVTRSSGSESEGVSLSDIKVGRKNKNNKNIAVTAGP